MKEKKLLPENDMQELWELHGRVYATCEYVKSVTYPEKDIILSMLGAAPDEVTALAQTIDGLEEELARKDEIISRMTQTEEEGF